MLDEVLGVGPVERLVRERVRVPRVELQVVVLLLDQHDPAGLGLGPVMRLQVHAVGVDAAAEEPAPAAAVDPAQPELAHEGSGERRLLGERLERFELARHGRLTIVHPIQRGGSLEIKLYGCGEFGSPAADKSAVDPMAWP